MCTQQSQEFARQNTSIYIDQHEQSGSDILRSREGVTGCRAEREGSGGNKADSGGRTSIYIDEHEQSGEGILRSREGVTGCRAGGEGSGGKEADSGGRASIYIDEHEKSGMDI